MVHYHIIADARTFRSRTRRRFAALAALRSFWGAFWFPGRGIDVRTGDLEQAEKRERRRTVFLRKHDFLVGVFLSSVADHDGLSEKMELWRRSLGSGRATTGATDTFSRRPLSVASRPFMGGS